MKDEGAHGGGDQATPAKTGDGVAGQVVGVVGSDTPKEKPTIETAKIRILHRIIDELRDANRHHKKAIAAYEEAIRRLRSDPPDSAGAAAKVQEGDTEARTAHDIEERVKGKEEAYGALE